MACSSDGKPELHGRGLHERRQYPWTDLTWLILTTRSAGNTTSRRGRSRTATTTHSPARRRRRTPQTPSIWNPLPQFLDVQQTHQLQKIVDVKQYFADARAGTLPEVSWIIPSNGNSEHRRHRSQRARRG